MVLISNGGGLAEVQEESPLNVAQDGLMANVKEALHISESRRGLLGDKNPEIEHHVKLKIIPPRIRLLKLNSTGSLASPSAKFRQITEERDEVSRSVPSSTSQGFRERINGHLWKICREWIKDPFNMALFVWIFCVAVSGAILFLVMTGMLDGALPKKSQRNAWFEVNNQILNALFTLMCLYQHPKRFHHLVLLCRWKPKDISTLRKIYCKNGTYKPNEWAHMMVVVVLLHVNCFAQYALCGLNWGYKRSERPAIGVGICLSVAIVAPAIAGLYSIISPLGREYHTESDEETVNQMLSNSCGYNNRRKSLEKRFSFASRNEQRIAEYVPQWRGALFDLLDDLGTAYLSLFCSFCVFGWNMERLGFGNMYVHIATFLLFCTAPFFIFNLAAINIDNETVREALGITGVVLCVFGLLYGGFWRIQMRKRFNLPANNSFCGKPAVADCAQWLFCCCCSLAQEVRTADYHDIVENKFCRKQMESGLPTLSPLSREDGAFQFRTNPTSPICNSPKVFWPGTAYPPNPSSLSKDPDSPGRQLSMMEGGLSTKAIGTSMKPPVLASIHREDINNKEQMK